MNHNLFVSLLNSSSLLLCIMHVKCLDINHSEFLITPPHTTWKKTSGITYSHIFGNHWQTQNQNSQRRTLGANKKYDNAKYRVNENWASSFLSSRIVTIILFLFLVILFCQKMISSHDTRDTHDTHDIHQRYVRKSQVNLSFLRTFANFYSEFSEDLRTLFLLIPGTVVRIQTRDLRKTSWGGLIRKMSWGALKQTFCENHK